VVKANAEQMNLVFDKFYQNKGNKDISVVFVAVDDDENITGYLVIEEMTVPPPLNGTDWFIWNIFTLPELRRRGIASALLKETIKHAEQANIRHLQGSANPTLQASMFWFKHNFCFWKYGQKLDDGNYYHMIFYRINKTEKENVTKQENCRIIKADKEQMNWIFDEYIINDSVPFFHDKRDDIFGFAAVDGDNNILGFITGYADEMYAPLDGRTWLIPCIFVKPELRRQGIGCALIKEMIKAAKEANINQLTCAVSNEEASKFWYNNNFGIFFWKHVGSVNTATIAALRI
jgi:ribosomal protein S18 acetylase RimI-like enzyme